MKNKLSSLVKKKDLDGLDKGTKKTYILSAGWSSPVARRAHNPEVAGSNPVSATKHGLVVIRVFFYLGEKIWKRKVGGRRRASLRSATLTLSNPVSATKHGLSNPVS